MRFLLYSFGQSWNGTIYTSYITTRQVPGGYIDNVREPQVIMNNNTILVAGKFSTFWG